MQEFPTNPAQLEQQLAAQLEQQFESSAARLRGLRPSDRLMTVEEIMAAVACANDLERTLHAYEPAALYLNALGSPRLLERIESIRRDTQAAKTTFIATLPTANVPQVAASTPPYASPSGRPVVANDTDRESTAAIAALGAEEQALKARLHAFALSSGSASPDQLQGYINELNGFVGRLWALRPTANALLSKGQLEFSQRLEALIQRAQQSVGTYQSVLRSRMAHLQTMGWRLFP